MYRALIRKDVQLLRSYIRIGLFASALIYLVTAIIVVWALEAFKADQGGWIGSMFLVLKNASNLGLALTTFAAALLAGSVFSLERADRSAEFLACLPPSRVQNLISKLTVVFSVISIQLGFHLLMAVAAWLLLPHVRSQSFSMELDLANYGVLSMSVLTVAGGALAASALLRSNGVPILCGFLSPFLCVSFAGLLTWALSLPMEADAFSVRLATTFGLYGVVTTICAGLWYVSRSTP